MTAQTMIEKMARSIAEANERQSQGLKFKTDDWINAGPGVPNGGCEYWRLFVDHARAALQALREPTEEMVEQFAQEVCEYRVLESDRQAVRRGFKKAIDAVTKGVR